MWTDATREKYERSGLRYASDLTDAEWAVLEAVLAPPSSLGRPRKTDLREVMNAILYMARSGCQWRMLPGEFPPRGTVQYYFYKWRDDGRGTKPTARFWRARARPRAVPPARRQA